MAFYTTVDITTFPLYLNAELAPLAGLGLIAGKEDTDRDSHDGFDTSQVVKFNKKSIIADVLAKGLSVDVNGSPWQRVFIRIEDGTDEAVIIIYGLMPGREYDVQLGLVQGDSNGIIRQQITTEGAFSKFCSSAVLVLKLVPEVELESSEVPTDPESPDAYHSISSSDPSVSTPSTSPNRTLPNTPPSTTVSLSTEDRLSQLQHNLAIVNAERESLVTALKSARRDSQKADAALRSEIEILKRTSEKHVAADHRNKQKILSLQEAVKRAQMATSETEELVKELEELLPELNRQRQEKEVNCTKVKEMADRVRKERDLHVEREKKELDSMKSELAGLTNKMEKLNVKKEKLEGGTITALEEQLQSVQHEIEQAQKEAQVQLTYAMFMDRTDFVPDDLHYSGAEASLDRSPASPYISTPRMRSQLSNPGLIGRPAPIPPIQRPSHNDNNYGQQASLWSHAPRQLPTHTPRSSSLQDNETPTPLTNPNHHPSKSATNSPSNSIISSSSLHHSISSTSTSSLSSGAPAFEPGRPLKNILDNPSDISAGFSVTLTPIQRPGPISRAPGFNHPKSTSQHADYLR
ncbi:hypothetical protein C0991_009964 [Blastosporella zonata]|nr:hypothetical protein C0991_009964 [Blastosporella zonata]